MSMLTGADVSNKKADEQIKQLGRSLGPSMAGVEKAKEGLEKAVAGKAKSLSASRTTSCMQEDM